MGFAANIHNVMADNSDAIEMYINNHEITPNLLADAFVVQKNNPNDTKNMINSRADSFVAAGNDINCLESTLSLLADNFKKLENTFVAPENGTKMVESIYATLAEIFDAVVNKLPIPKKISATARTEAVKQVKVRELQKMKQTIARSEIGFGAIKTD